MLNEEELRRQAAGSGVVKVSLGERQLTLPTVDRHGRLIGVCSHDGSFYEFRLDSDTDGLGQVDGLRVRALDLGKPGVEQQPVIAGFSGLYYPHKDYY